MGAYLNANDFLLRSLLASQDVNYVQQLAPGFIDTRIAINSSLVDARMRKRYGASLPWAAGDVPEIILKWVTDLTSYDVLRKRGMNPSDPNAELARADYDRALAEMVEAANSDTGLFDLPVAQDSTASGISSGAPLGYSEASPYVWQSRQRCAGRSQDDNGSGS